VADEPISEDALLEALQQLKVSDLLVQTLSTVSSLAYHRLSEEHRDLEQARLAIDALRALVPVLADSVPADLVRDFQQVTANLQLAYAAAVSGSATAGRPSSARRGDERAAAADEAIPGVEEGVPADE
jgi:hypothetical protein